VCYFFLKESNVLKSVSKIYVGQNNKKVGKLVLFAYFSNRGKYWGQISLGNSK
jgi:hypothetical protein